MTQQIEKTKKNDFVEIKFTSYANGEIFDSNIQEDLKKLNPKAEPQKTIVIIGQGMIVKGLDKSLENKELNKEYEVSFTARDGFGERHRELVKTIPLSAFTEQKVAPRAGMVLTLDNYLVKIITVSGARVITDFNNPLAGKEIKYKFTIVRKLEDEKEKIETLFNLFYKLIPEYEIKENSIIVKGPKNFEMFIDAYKEKVKELLGKELVFKEMTKEELGEELKKNQHEHHSGAHSHEQAHENISKKTIE